MDLPLLVHCDPRKTTRSSNVLVAEGTYIVEHNVDDSEVYFVMETGEKTKLVKELPGNPPLKFLASSMTKIFIEISKAGKEPHITIGLKNGPVS